MLVASKRQQRQPHRSSPRRTSRLSSRDSTRALPSRGGIAAIQTRRRAHRQARRLDVVERNDRPYVSALLACFRHGLMLTRRIIRSHPAQLPTPAVHAVFDTRLSAVDLSHEQQAQQLSSLRCRPQAPLPMPPRVVLCTVLTSRRRVRTPRSSQKCIPSCLNCSQLNGMYM